MPTEAAQTIRTQPRFLLPAAVIGLAFLYILALDQGLLLSLVQGNAAFDMNMIHEFVHDARHAAGFPCH
jgi:cobalt transporter subunit CbtB